MYGGDEAAVSNELDRTPKCPSLPNLIDVIGRYGIVEVAIHLDRFRSSTQYIHCRTHNSSSRTAPSYSSVYRWNSCMGKRPADDDNPYCDRFSVRAPLLLIVTFVIRNTQQTGNMVIATDSSLDSSAIQQKCSKKDSSSS